MSNPRHDQPRTTPDKDRHGLNRRSFLGMAAAGATGACVTGSTASGETAVGDSNRLPFSRELPLGKPYQVVVCGGGPSGVAAALAARRAGLEVLLVEGQGQLGGMGTSGLVSHWLGGRSQDCREWVVGGLFREMAEEAVGSNFALLPTRAENYQPHGWYAGLAHGIPFDPYAMAAYLDRKMAAAGVDVLLFTQAVDVRVEKGRITHVIVFNKSGLAAVPTTAVIDATGDADLAARSGCPLVEGREEDGLMTPATLQFHVHNVDQEILDEYINQNKTPRFREKIRQLRQAGEWTFPYEIFISVQLHEPGTMMINTSRLCDVDGTDGESVTQGMIRGRDETQELLALMQKHFPGFSQARLKSVAPLLGVRETRRIRGPFVLSVDDLVKGTDFDDTIGLSSYGWDLPDPKRPSHQPMSGKVRRKRPVTPIPYRIMVPGTIENLICPGRAVSVERHVLGPLRVTGPCFAMGQAAGQAAAQVADGRSPFDQINVATLREELRQNGAIIDWA